MTEDEGKPAEDAEKASAPDPLVAPVVRQMAHDFAAGTLTPEGMAEPIAGTDWPLVPEPLRAFVQSCEFARLVEALRANPKLYWHPVIARQVMHLQNLASSPGFDVEREQLVEAARTELERLITTHADSLVWGRQLDWKWKPGKSGPKTAIPNPYPRDIPGSDPVDSSQIYLAWRRLWSVFSQHQEAIRRQPGETETAYLKRLNKCVHNLLSDTDIPWSGLWSLESATPPAPSAEASEEALSMSFAEPIRWHTDFASTLKAASANSELIGKDGLPATLAYFIVGHLLTSAEQIVTGEMVRDKIENYRRSLKKQAPA